VVGDLVMRTVAFKLLSPPTFTLEGAPASPEQRDALVDRQLAELQFAAQLDHPGLIRTYSVGMTRLPPPVPEGLEGELLYIVMELGATTLTTELAQGPLPPDGVLALARQMADVLAYLHDAPGLAPGGGLAHRDIKPANILRVRSATGRERWKLSDLGTMRPFGAADSSRLDRMGTAEYAPPEAFDGVVGPEWDIWSLGVVLAEALGGDLPFGPAGGAHTAAGLERSIREDAPRLPAPLPPPFDKLLPGMLQKDAAQRLKIADVLALLGAAVAPQPAAQPAAAPPVQRVSTFPPVAAPAPWSGNSAQRPPAAAPAAPPPAPPSPALHPQDTAAEQQLRTAIQRALEDNVISPYERAELNELRKRLGIRLERAATIFREEHEARGAQPRRPAPANAPAASAPPLAPPQPLTAPPQAVPAQPLPGMSALSSPLPLDAPDPSSFRRVNVVRTQDMAPLPGPAGQPPAAAAPAASYVVDQQPGTGADFRSIGAAVAAAAPGSQIRIRPGTYREALLLTQAVELVAEGTLGQVVIESHNRHAVVINGDGVSLRHLVLCAVSDSAGSTSDIAVSALVVSRGRLEAENCSFECSSENCVAVFGSSALPRFRGCQISGARSVGLSATHDARVVAEDCRIAASGLAAAMCSNGGQLRLERCRLSTGKRYGALVYVEGLATLNNCEISGNGEDGVALKNGGRADLESCAVRQNGGYAVLVQPGCRASVANCDLRGNRLPGISAARGATVARRNNQE
jgi:serine/threonine protein kinase